MNSPECIDLEDFFEHLERIHDIEQFVEARARFERAVAQQLDATYVLIQRVVPLGRAVNQAQARTNASDQAEHDRAPAFAFSDCAGRAAGDLDLSVDEGEHLFI